MTAVKFVVDQDEQTLCVDTSGINSDHFEVPMIISSIGVAITALFFPVTFPVFLGSFCCRDAEDGCWPQVMGLMFSMGFFAIFQFCADLAGFGTFVRVLKISLKICRDSWCTICDIRSSEFSTAYSLAYSLLCILELKVNS